MSLRKTDGAPAPASPAAAGDRLMAVLATGLRALGPSAAPLPLLPLLPLPTAAPPSKKYTLVRDDFDELMDLPPDLLYLIYANEVANSPDPCTRVSELCSANRASAGMCESDAFWNWLNRMMLFYGPYAALSDIPPHPSYTVTTAKNWFGRCCVLANGGIPKLEYATPNPPGWMVEAATKGKKIQKIATDLASELDLYVAALKEAIADPSEDARLAGEEYYYLNKTIENDRPTDPYEYKVLQDQFQGVVRSLEERPGHRSGSMIMEPLGFVIEIFQASYKLVELIRSTAPATFESERIVNEVDRWFNVLTDANKCPDDCTTWADGYYTDNLYVDGYPEGVRVALRALLLWNSLPYLRRKYVYQDGRNYPDTFEEQMGFFRNRAPADGDALAVASSEGGEVSEVSEEGSDPEDEDASDED